jgi:hypothetical protein
MVIGRLIMGLVFGLKYGKAARVQHFTLRQVLHRKKRTPWNYAKFLDFAADRRLMKKSVGAISSSIECYWNILRGRLT